MNKDKIVSRLKGSIIFLLIITIIYDFLNLNVFNYLNSINKSYLSIIVINRFMIMYGYIYMVYKLASKKLKCAGYLGIILSLFTIVLSFDYFDLLFNGNIATIFSAVLLFINSFFYINESDYFYNNKPFVIDEQKKETLYKRLNQNSIFLLFFNVIILYIFIKTFLTYSDKLFLYGGDNLIVFMYLALFFSQLIYAIPPIICFSVYFPLWFAYNNVKKDEVIIGYIMFIYGLLSLITIYGIFICKNAYEYIKMIDLIELNNS